MQLESSLLVPWERWYMGDPTLPKVIITSQLTLLPLPASPLALQGRTSVYLTLGQIGWCGESCPEPPHAFAALVSSVSFNQKAFRAVISF